MLKNYRWLSLAVLIMIIDIISKAAALKYLQPYQAKSILPFFNFTLAFNYGAAFGFLNQGPGWQNMMFIGIALVVSMILFIWLYQLKPNEKLSAVAICSILGGAWGNLIDRLYYGCVIDFLDFHLGHYHWPIFNIADSAICVGAGLLLIDAFFEEKAKSVKDQKKEGTQ